MVIVKQPARCIRRCGQFEGHVLFEEIQYLFIVCMQRDVHLYLSTCSNSNKNIIFACVSVCVHVCLCMDVCVYACVCVSMCAYVCVYIYICIYACVQDIVCVHVRVCACACVCMCVCVHVCVCRII